MKARVAEISNPTPLLFIAVYHITTRDFFLDNILSCCDLENSTERDAISLYLVILGQTYLFDFCSSTSTTPY